MTNDLDLIRHVREPNKDVREYIVQVEFRQGCVQLFFFSLMSAGQRTQDNCQTDQCIECLVRRLARFETIVDLVLPRTHLYSADELRSHSCLAVQRRK